MAQLLQKLEFIIVFAAAKIITKFTKPVDNG